MNASGWLLARLTVLGVLGAFGMTAALPVHADDASPESSQKSAAAELAALHEAPWDRRGDFILSASASLEALAELPDDAPAARSWAEGGSRTGWFGEAWTDVDGDGCDTRNEILARDLTDTDFSRADGVQSREEGRGRGAGVCPDATVWAGLAVSPLMRTCPALQALVAAERDLICRTLHSQTSMRADVGAPGVLLPLGAERG